MPKKFILNLGRVKEETGSSEFIIRGYLHPKGTEEPNSSIALNAEDLLKVFQELDENTDYNVVWSEYLPGEENVILYPEVD